MATLQTYEEMSALTGRMVDAARANDWDQLCELEQELGRMRDWLRVNDIVPAQLDEQQRQRKVDLIKRMLADDREVRRHTEPWMENVRTLLSSGQRSRNLQATYGAMR